MNADSELASTPSAKSKKNLVPVSFACILHTSITPSQQLPTQLGTMSSILCHTLPLSTRPFQHGMDTLKLQCKALSDLGFLGLYSLLKCLQGIKKKKSCLILTGVLGDKTSL